MSDAAAALPRSASVQHYIRAAIAPSTRSTYATAQQNYRDYCKGRRWDPQAAVTEERAEEWLAALADSGRHAASTIRTYKAALSTLHEETSSSPNPVATERVKRLMAGIENDKAAREAARRRLKPKSDGVTMNMVRRMAETQQAGTEKEIMMIGAAALAAAGGFRPGEVFNSTSARRALTTEQVQFFARAGDAKPIADVHRQEPGFVPDHCTVELYISKTNQRGAREEVHIAAPAAVRAIWAWRQKRYRDEENAARGDEFFRRAGYKPLALSALLGYLRCKLRQLDFGELHLTGKCFRIGAASTLAAAGVETADLRDLGRWRTNMWRTYADGPARKARALIANRLM